MRYTFGNIKTRGRMDLDENVQIRAFIGWSQAETGLKLVDLVDHLLTAADQAGVTRPSDKAMRTFLKRVRKSPFVRKDGLFAKTVSLTDQGMKTRQIHVFKLGLRGTVFDKMDRIRAREVQGIPYARMTAPVRGKPAAAAA